MSGEQAEEEAEAIQAVLMEEQAHHHYLVLMYQQVAAKAEVPSEDMAAVAAV